MTASATTQSSQTDKTVVVSKYCVLAGIFAGLLPAGRSLRTAVVSQAAFWPSVSAGKISVPGIGVGLASGYPRIGIRARSHPGRTPGLLFLRVGIEAEGLELTLPFGGRIAKTLDADAAGQAAFNGSSHQIRGKEGQRDRHVDLTRAALLTRGDLLHVGHHAGYALADPAAVWSEDADQAGRTFGPAVRDSGF